MKLILFVSICFHVFVRISSGNNCLHQPETLRVTEGESITIPCAYSNAEYHLLNQKNKIAWRDSKNDFCWRHLTYYNSFEDFTGAEYQGRISRRRNPDSNKTDSLTIHGLRKTDGPRICCYLIRLEDNVRTYSLGNVRGTTLLFSDEIWVDQLEAVPALTGESVTIPCYVNYPHNSNITVSRVTWYKGEEICDKEIHQWKYPDVVGRFSLVNFPSDLSLRIDDIQTEDAGKYCCHVEMREGIFRRNYGTELVIKGTNLLHNVSIIQPLESLAEPGTSTILNCSFTFPQDKNLLNTRVYWRVGSPQGVYSYHPDERMIDQSYKGRTELKGNLDLEIDNVQEEDETFYYCFVMLTLCDSNIDYKSVVDHGQGTNLTVTSILKQDHTEPFREQRNTHTNTGPRKGQREPTSEFKEI